MSSVAKPIAFALVWIMGCGAGNEGLTPSPGDATIDECDPTTQPDCVEMPNTPELQPPDGYPTLVFAGTPTDADETFDDFLARTGLTRRWGDSTEADGDPPPRYGLATIDGRRAFEVVALQGTRGANAGLLLPGMPRDGVVGGPRESFGRVKAYWDPSFDYNPRKRDADGNWTVRDGAGGCKFAGFWGGNIPATSNKADNDGWALTIWTGSSSNYISLGLDLDHPRRDDGYATTAIYRTDDTWRIDRNSGRWVQLEWEHIIEPTAGGEGRVRMWIDGELGIDRVVRYFDPTQWDAGAGLKGVYLRNFWGGAGRAPVDTPMYYADIEVWAR